ncbi:Crp/Fnr family transcriptional regulator [Subsaximicrobium wynnwilliamsii]|uniref:Crp/Fnr family transcriptional regulator n=1 Tax=Subsaximicrobium wynnwilliamsii TaxID=291179 RepID=A0A5C6ZFT8_9FLAO|nr:Crp/Fnr family transcriptional regulator [Subsaximicrobium wynnwilliamsii]TXD84065.1 Crp/Fnr family transcriptional regulator [Subsaximicrobium wynnwilliamsii]TXD88977.1 Crp/Fnr family transcriptional regulator [Subsaximicrobium wynnwilliamsii]TXE03777.1 Crp/Fnr family transcriptional regulator [Subsaximicrobium wynnwilliamsii]
MLKSIVTHIKQYVKPSAEELNQFTALLQEVSVAKRKFLLLPGTHVKHEYFVFKGCLKAYYMDDKGNKHVVQFAIENWWIGDFDAFYNQVSSKLHIEAIEDSQLLAINYDDLQALYDEAPVFERYFRLLVTSAFVAQRKRILSALEKDAKARYLEFRLSYPSIETRVPNYHIANYLGVSAESLSRIRRSLKS